MIGFVIFLAGTFLTGLKTSLWAFGITCKGI